MLSLWSDLSIVGSFSIELDWKSLCTHKYKFDIRNSYLSSILYFVIIGGFHSQISSFMRDTTFGTKSYPEVGLLKTSGWMWDMLA